MVLGTSKIVAVVGIVKKKLRGLSLLVAYTGMILVLILLHKKPNPFLLSHCYIYFFRAFTSLAKTGQFIGIIIIEGRNNFKRCSIVKDGILYSRFNQIDS